MRIIALTPVITVLAFALGPTAQAAEIKVIAANPMKAVIQQLGAQFERDTGHKLVATFVAGPAVKREIDSGAAFDLAISATPVIDGLVKEGKLTAATRTEVARIGVAAGVRAGAPRPDISSAETFKRALLNAKSVAHSAEGPSGVYFLALLGRLGIADQMKPKLMPLAGDPLAKAVPSGAAEMIISATPDILTEGTDMVGPLPPDLQQYIGFAAGVGSVAKEAAAASDLLKFLISPAAAPVMRANGIEPNAPR